MITLFRRLQEVTERLTSATPVINHHGILLSRLILPPVLAAAADRFRRCGCGADESSSRADWLDRFDPTIPALKET
jgi:hypothetical protein